MTINHTTVEQALNDLFDASPASKRLPTKGDFQSQRDIIICRDAFKDGYRAALASSQIATQPDWCPECHSRESNTVTRAQPAMSDEGIDSLMYQHTGINRRQFPNEYEELKRFADAVLTASPQPIDQTGGNMVDGPSDGICDANWLVGEAKARPNDYFLKGSGVTKLLDAIRNCEREIKELKSAAEQNGGVGSDVRNTAQCKDIEFCGQTYCDTNCAQPVQKPADLGDAMVAVRNQALEDAALECWRRQCRPEYEPEFHDKLLRQVEDSIRALKSQQTGDVRSAHPVQKPVAAVTHLIGDAALAHEQCRVVVHLASALAEVHVARANTLVNSDREIAEIIGQSTAEIMEWLGTVLSNMDALDEKADEWTESIFEKAQNRWLATSLEVPNPVALPNERGIREACDLLLKIRGSYANWQGWSGIEGACDKAINLLQGHNASPLSPDHEASVRDKALEDAALLRSLINERNPVDTIYLDNGYVIDVGGEFKGNLRAAIAATRKPEGA